MIRITFTAMPRRSTVLAAKAAVITGVVMTAGAVAVLASVLAGRLILAGHGLNPARGYQTLSLTDGPVLRAAAGSVVYLVLIALFSLGVATAVRDSAAAIGVVPGRWNATRQPVKECSADLTLTRRAARPRGFLPSYAGFLLRNQPLLLIAECRRLLEVAAVDRCLLCPSQLGDLLVEGTRRRLPGDAQPPLDCRQPVADRGQSVDEPVLADGGFLRSEPGPELAGPDRRPGLLALVAGQHLVDLLADHAGVRAQVDENSHADAQDEAGTEPTSQRTREPGGA